MQSKKAGSQSSASLLMGLIPFAKSAYGYFRATSETSISFNTT
jgi:hypothetical protein